MPNQIVTTEADRRELRRLRDKVDGMRGPGVVNTPTAITVSPSTVAERPAAQPFKIKPGLKYQVLMTIDDAGTLGMDWPRIHA